MRLLLIVEKTKIKNKRLGMAILKTFGGTIGPESKNLTFHHRNGPAYFTTQKLVLNSASYHFLLSRIKYLDGIIA